MGQKPSLRRLILILTLVLLWPGQGFAGVPTVKDLMVTDVTPNSFSVIWVTNEPCTADIKVYLDAQATMPAENAVVTAHPLESGSSSIKTKAEDQGVMKVRVEGLNANTAYYFTTVSTSKSTSESTNYPALTALMEVSTESQTVRTTGDANALAPFSNDLIIEPCYLNDGQTVAEGTLIVATVKGAHYPLTAFVGDGIAIPYAMVDLNNLYGAETFETLDLSTRENLTVLNYRGTNGYAIITYKVPVDNGLSEARAGDPSLKTGWNMASFPLEPLDSTTTAVISPIIDKITSVWAYQAGTGKWVFYDKDGASFLNRLGELHAAQGFWFMMKDNASLPLKGTFSTQPIALKAGWNLVGSRSIRSVPLQEALAPINTYLSSIWSYDPDENKWVFYDKNGAAMLNRLTHVEPGKAYWVYVTQDCTW